MKFWAIASFPDPQLPAIIPTTAKISKFHFSLMEFEVFMIPEITSNTPFPPLTPPLRFILSFPSQFSWLFGRQQTESDHVSAATTFSVVKLELQA